MRDALSGACAERPPVDFTASQSTMEALCPEPSHVLRAMGLSGREAQGSVRISLGRATREEDVDVTAHALAETVERLRRISTI